MDSVNAQTLSSDAGPIVGIGLVIHPDIVTSSPASVSDGVNKASVPLMFFKGNLNIVRSQLHQLIDEQIDEAMELFHHKNAIQY